MTTALSVHNPTAGVEAHRMSGPAVLEALGTVLASGLSDVEARQRRGRVGANVLSDPDRIPGWKRFVGQSRTSIRSTATGFRSATGHAWPT